MMQIDFTKFRPMASQHVDFAKLVYPVDISPKLDGIRCVIHPEKGPVTRTMKPIPNHYCRHILNDQRLWGLDGELVVGDPTHPQVYNKTQSGIMSADGNPDFTYIVFDWILASATGYKLRYDLAHAVVRLYHESAFISKDYPIRVMMIRHYTCLQGADINSFEIGFLNEGYEGAMIRQLSSPYKWGRASPTHGGLLKLKRYEDAEATIVGFEPLERNQNEAQKDAFGLQKRSSHQAGKVQDNLLGKLLVTASPWGEFSIGSGFDVPLRQEIWDNKEKWLGKKVTFKHLPHGALDKPRHPIYKGVRYD